MIATKTFAHITMLGLRGVARVGSLLSIGLILLFFTGEPFHPTQIPLKQWIGLTLFPLGVVIGMIIAWWRPGLGAGVTLLSLLIFYGIYGLLFGNRLGGWFIVFAAPAFLFLLYSSVSRSKFTEVTS